MAKFNVKSVNEKFLNDKKTMEECGMYLQSLLSDEELEALKEDWNSSGGFKVIPWWKFCFDNIRVSYEHSRNKRKGD